MLASTHRDAMQMLNDVKVERFITHDDYIELIVHDDKGNEMEIEFYPAEERGEE